MSRYHSFFVFSWLAFLVFFSWLVNDSAVSAERWGSYRHPIGIEFKYPQSWTVVESVLGLQVNPPDIKSTAQGPTEVHFFTIMGTDPRVQSLADPLAASLLNSLVVQYVPGLRPKGGSRPVGNQGGRVFSWSAADIQGMNVHCDVYGLVSEGYFISLTSYGQARAVERRRGEMEQVFKTLALKAPQADPKHASTWYSNSFSSSGPSGTRVNTNTQHTMIFLPNGRLSSSAQTSVHGWNHNQSGDRTSVTGVTDASTEEGRWAVSGNSLYLLWKDSGVVKWSVYIQGNPGRREMYLTPATGGKGVLWTEYPDF